MPLYEYECKKCHHRFEKIQTFSAKHVKKCPECGGPIEQLISAPSVQFKGSGWYVTDYAKKSGGGSSPGTNGDSSKDIGKDSEKSESKGEGTSKSEEKSKSDDKPKSEKKKAEKK